MKYSEACAILGLDPSLEILPDADPDGDESSSAASSLMLKKAFKKAALQHHPDKNLAQPEQAKEAFQRVSTAYNFLSLCVARGQTGPHQPRLATADTYEQDDDDDVYETYDDDDDDDVYRTGGGGGAWHPADIFFQEKLFHMFFSRMHAPRSRGAYGGGGDYGGHSFSGGMFGGGFRGGPRRSYDYEYDYGDDDDDDDDSMDDAFFERMNEQARRKEEAREKAKKRRDEHAQYLAERGRQAEAEGRELFEAWNIKQLTGECQRRGISIKGKQQKDIIEVLIHDEAQKRLREQLKEEAPLLDQWAEVISMPHRQDMNGTKVRVIDFYDGTFILLSACVSCCDCYRFVYQFVFPLPAISN